uniref:ESPR-type extended signal peptide-containing protein n=1 Tax=Glaesserella sp. TaxID=2094731 RepID=UPI0035A00A79
MNKIYKIIWNAAIGAFVVVSEITKGKGKSSSNGKHISTKNTIVFSSVLFAFGLTPLASLASVINAGGGEGLAINVPASTSGGLVCGEAYAGANGGTAVMSNGNPWATTGTIAFGCNARAEGAYGYSNISSGAIDQSTSGRPGTHYKSVYNAPDGSGSAAIAIGNNALASTVAFDYNKGQGVLGRGGSVAIGGMSTAQGVNSLAVGPYAFANASISTALGSYATVTSKAVGSIAIGRETRVDDVNSVAIGFTAYSKGWSSVAMGYKATASGVRGIAIGSSDNVSEYAKTPDSSKTRASGFDSIAIGSKAQATETGAMALGVSSVATGTQATVLGALANAEADQSVAIGRGAKTISTVSATGARSGGGVAIGRDANASGAGANAMGINAVAVSHGIAIGTNANVAGASSISIGTGSNSSGINSVSVGARAKSLGDNTVAVGQASNASGKSAVAVGDGANSSNNQTVAVGTSSKASAQGATAFGDSTNASGLNSLALGIASKASQENAVSVGASADASKANAVALGASSTTSTSATLETTATVGHLTYGGFKTKAGIAVGDQVSVGAAGNERQIKHVAAGNISTTSTDVINGSQLYATQDVMSNLANALKTSLGGQTVLNSNGTITTTNIGATNKNTVHEAIEYVNNLASSGIKVGADKGLEASDVNPVKHELGTTLSVVAGNATETPTDNLLTTVTKETSKGATETKVTISMKEKPTFKAVNLVDGANRVGLTPTADGVKVAKADGTAAKISNVANGTTDGDAVNLSQLNATNANVTTLQNDMTTAKSDISNLKGDVAKGWNITTAKTGTGNVS